MIDFVVRMLAASLPALLSIYWICLIVGGGLLIISSVAGGDADAGLDADVDVHVDAGHAHASALTTWFSLQFVVFFMAVFGVIGVAMSYLTQQQSAVVLIGALVGGLIVGQTVHQVLQKLRRTSGDSTPKAEHYVNKLGRVTIAVAGGKTGEVALRVGRAERFLPAVAKHSDQDFETGQPVGVVDYRDGVVEVVSREEYEFLGDKSS